MGTYGDSSAPEHPLHGSGTREDTATLTKAEGLPPDPHHPPQLPRRAGQQQVTGEPEGGEANVTPFLSPQSQGRRDRQPRDGTYRFWVSASITMEM